MPFARTDDRVRLYFEEHFGNRDEPEARNRTVLEFLARCDQRARE